MLLLTATSSPLSITDAQYIYRCLDASSKQASKLTSLLLKDNHRFTKTFLSRCNNLAHSLYKKLLRCATILGTRNVEFNVLLKEAAALSASLSSKLNFPSKFRRRSITTTTTNKRAGEGSTIIIKKDSTSLLDRVKVIQTSIIDIFQTVEKMLATRTSGISFKSEKEVEPKNRLLEEFFTKAETNLGWKVQRGSTSPKEKDTNLEGDPFSVGCCIVDELSLPYDTLLPNDVEVGLVSFSILLLEAYRLSKTVLRECGQMSPLHKVFGTYVILQNVTLMGIHRDLMRVIKGGKEVIDDERFRYLIPYLGRNYPETEKVLAQTFPSGPPRFARHHYYSPLLPLQLINAPRFSLGNWNFLADRNITGTEHSCF